ncbi:uncharacterized protein LOC106083735 [Stomoxys calcitrans]|uniref:Uncharacterized protein n=1 Tax=Stomoxys calcitrans TaxID=35570 RepID=A0A1I8PMR2_STOCA|nr:uncharacterized protein LOC106083735 [Stomoxys calcitrans]
MKMFTTVATFIFLALMHQTMAGPVEVEKSKSTSENPDDMNTSETFGYGYYQPGFYAAAPAVPLAAVEPYHAATYSAVDSYPVVSAPLPTKTTVRTFAGNGRSAYGYGSDSGYKYGSGFDRRWGYGSGAAARGTLTNEVYRRHPVYVAWG